MLMSETVSVMVIVVGDRFDIEYNKDLLRLPVSLSPRIDAPKGVFIPLIREGPQPHKSLTRVLGTAEADVPVASTGVAGKAVAEVAREATGRNIEYVVATACDALTQGNEIFTTVMRIVGIGLEQAGRPFSLVARKV